MKNKWEPLSAEELAEYKRINETMTGMESLPPLALQHAERMRTVGGVGIEELSYMNKDYLGTFMAPFSRDSKNADIAIVGVPIEGFSPINSSHKLAPTELRKKSKIGMGTVSGDMVAPFEMCRIIDYGNIDIYGYFDLKKSIDAVEAELTKIVQDGADLFIWGGDHSITYPPLKALGEKYGPLSVIHFDAHYDLTTRAAFDNEYTSGAFFTRAASNGYIDPKRLVQLGMRGRQSYLVKGAHELYGTTALTADEIWDMTYDEIAQIIIDTVGDGPTYLTFDLDCLDPTEMISNSSPEPNGITSRQVHEIIKRIKDKVNLVGCDVAEYAPMWDPSGKDAIVACGIAWDLFCWLSERRADRQGINRVTDWPLAMGYSSL